MIHVAWALLLLIATVAWFLLALLPALREHYSRTDVGPLRVTTAAADVRYFAISFQQFVNARIEALRNSGDAAFPRVSNLPDGSKVWYVPPSRADALPVSVFQGASDTAIANGLVVISEASVRVPSDVQVLKELYTTGQLTGDTGCIYRAVLTHGDARLGAGSEVLRWCNAGNELTVGPNSTLWGRASCWGTMSIGEGTRFQRLAAPRIEFGRPTGERIDNTLPGPVMSPPSHVTVLASRWMVSGDLTVPAGHSIEADLIVSGRLTVGRGAWIGGAVRCDVLVADESAVFFRSVVATRSLTLAAQCHVAGPVVVERDAVIGDDCHIGAPEEETTITALSVKVGMGVVMHGEIWARLQGEVTPLPRAAKHAVEAA